MIRISKMMYLKLTPDFLLCFFSYLWFLNKLNFHSLNIFNDRILREIDFSIFLSTFPNPSQLITKVSYLNF